MNENENPNEEMKESVIAEETDIVVEESVGTKKKRWWLIPLVTVLAVLAVGAAYIGGRLFISRPAGAQNSVVELGAGSVMISSSVEMEQADELPERSPEVFGIFDHFDDNTLYIQEMVVDGNGVASLSMDSEGNLETNNDSGVVKEILVTRDTLIYRDRSMENFAPNSSEPLKAKLEPATLEDIGKNSVVTVWGRQEGERVIAEVINFTK